MGLTATRKQFPPSREAAAFDARAWRERVADQSWSARALKALRGAEDRAATSFRSWLPVLKDCDRAVRDRLAAVRRRCAPSVAEALDGCAVAVERIALGARELSYRTSSSRELTRVGIVVALPAVFFLCFALARWFAGEDPSAAARSADTGVAHQSRGSHVGISSTLVEPPALGGPGQAAATVPSTEAAIHGPWAARGAAAPDTMATRNTAANTARNTITTPRVPATAHVPAKREAPSANVGADAPSATHFPFAPKPRPRRDS